MKYTEGWNKTACGEIFLSVFLSYIIINLLYLLDNYIRLSII